MNNRTVAVVEYRPLVGVRVLAFENAASLPAATRLLADIGAEVIRVAEPPHPVGPYARVFDGVLMNKESIALDLKNSQGLAVARRLCAEADVVCNNFRPRVMRKFGLDYHSLLTLNPTVISLQLTGYGTPGPWEDFRALGPGIEAGSGMNGSMGRDGDPPQRIGGGIFADTLAGRYAALAICAAIVHRDLTGEGQHIDLSMHESIVTGIGDLVTQASAEGAPPTRYGNRDERWAPQGVYRARGNDQWLAISVTADAQWRALKRILADQRLDKSDYDGVAGRWSGHAEIDISIEEWTRRRDKREAAETLQQAGVPAGPVQWPDDIAHDPQYRARGFFQMVTHEFQPILGYTSHPYLSLAARIDGYQRTTLSDHQPEGSRTNEVLRRWIGATDEELASWRQSGAIPPERPVIPVGEDSAVWFGENNVPRDPEFAERLNLAPADEAG